MDETVQGYLDAIPPETKRGTFKITPSEEDALSINGSLLEAQAPPTDP